MTTTKAVITCADEPEHTCSISVNWCRHDKLGLEIGVAMCEERLSCATVVNREDLRVFADGLALLAEERSSAIDLRDFHNDMALELKVVRRADGRIVLGGRVGTYEPSDDPAVSRWLFKEQTRVGIEMGFDGIEVERAALATLRAELLAIAEIPNQPPDAPAFRDAQG